MSVGRNVRGAKYLWGEMSVGRNVCGAKCLWGEMSVVRNFHRVSCPSAKFHGASCNGASGTGFFNLIHPLWDLLDTSTV
jgi:hypothetical protein